MPLGELQLLLPAVVEVLIPACMAAVFVRGLGMHGARPAYSSRGCLRAFSRQSLALLFLLCMWAKRSRILCGPAASQCALCACLCV